MSGKRITGLHKGLQILSCFGPKKESLSAREIAEALAAPPSTVYRYLDTLIEDGFLTRNRGSGTYRLGYMLLHLGNQVSQSVGFLEIAKPHLSNLSRRFDETVLLMVRSGERVVCLDMKETSRPIRLNMKIGTVLPLYAGASSKVLLAYQPEEFIKDYLKKSVLKKVAPNTILSKEELLTDLKKILRQGFAVTEQDVSPGVIGIAAPIFDAGGAIVASFVLAGPVERLGSREEELVPAVVESARAASRELGYRSEKGSNQTEV